MKVGRDLKRPSPHVQFGSEGYSIELDSSEIRTLSPLQKDDLYLLMVYLCLKRVGTAAYLDGAISEGEFKALLAPYSEQAKLEKEHDLA